MFPVRDVNPTTRPPVVTWSLIGIDVAVFAFAWAEGPAGVERFVRVLGLVPAELLALSSPSALLAPLTSIFMHASWAHLLGNVWFLHIFGDNVEDHLGHARFVAFYLLAGLCAVAAHVVMAPFGTLPLVGASGAIAGVLGAYMVRYPRAPILAWFVIGFVELPAFAFLFVWFGYQLLMTFGSLGSIEQGGVAFTAHVGGFLAGIGLERLLRPGPDEVARRERERHARLEEDRARRAAQNREHRRWLDPD